MNDSTFVLSADLSARVKASAIGFAGADLKSRDAVIGLSELLTDACATDAAYDTVAAIMADWREEYGSAIEKATGKPAGDDASRKAWSRIVEKVNAYREAMMIPAYVKPKSDKPDAVRKEASAASGQPKKSLSRADKIARQDAEHAELMAKAKAAHDAGQTQTAALFDAQAIVLAAKTAELRDAEAKAASKGVPTAAKRVADAAKADAETAALLAWVLDNRESVAAFMHDSLSRKAARPSPANPTRVSKAKSVPVAKPVAA